MDLTRTAPLALVGLLCAAAPARAQTGSDPFAAAPRGALAIDGGVVVALPAALPTGVSTGAGAGVTFGCGLLAAGARASYGSVTEYTTSWTVSHSDLRLRATGALQRPAGRGLFALRLALGGTLVHETRTRNQGSRAGLSGEDLETTALRLIPAADLELAVSLRIAGRWDVVVSGGPSIDYFDGAAHTGWLTGVGVAWQP